MCERFQLPRHVSSGGNMQVLWTRVKLLFYLLLTGVQSSSSESESKTIPRPRFMVFLILLPFLFLLLLLVLGLAAFPRVDGM